VTIVLHRIDDRLIHGQVVVGWGQPLDIGFIVLVDDEVASSSWEQDLYRMGVPPEMELYFHDVVGAVQNLATYRADPRPGMLLTGDIATMRHLVDGTDIREVNVGGIHHRAGRLRHLRYVFLSPEEAEQLQELSDAGVAVTAQDVPGARPIPLDELLAEAESA
jgi:mannose/fructose/N-acetylgalactosamine-specific phosphotransferase system component IIB